MHGAPAASRAARCRFHGPDWGSAQRAANRRGASVPFRPHQYLRPSGQFHANRQAHRRTLAAGGLQGRTPPGPGFAGSRVAAIREGRRAGERLWHVVFGISPQLVLARFRARRRRRALIAAAPPALQLAGAPAVSWVADISDRPRQAQIGYSSVLGAYPHFGHDFVLISCHCASLS